MKRWVVWGQVIAPRLPTSALVIGDITVHTDLSPDLEKLLRLPAPQISLDSIRGYLMAGSSDRRISSKCYMNVEVAAPGFQEALDQVGNMHVPLLEAVLGLGTDLPARVELFAASQVGGGNFRYFAPRPGIQYDTPDPLTRRDTPRLRGLYDSLLADEQALMAVQLYHQAIDLTNMGTQRAVRAKAALTFYQVLEAIGLAVDWKPAADHVQRRREHLLSLRDILNGDSSDAEKSTRVTETHQEILRLMTKAGDLRIRYAEDTLNMSDTWKARRRELGTFRNKRLGHATLPSQSELAEWFDERPPNMCARIVARDFLRAYVQHQGPCRGTDSSGVDNGKHAE